MRTWVEPPTPPLRVTLTPGVRDSRSETTTAWRWRRVSAVMTVMLTGTSDSLSAARPAVTTTWSTSLASSTGSAASTWLGRARREGRPPGPGRKSSAFSNPPCAATKAGPRIRTGLTMSPRGKRTPSYGAPRPDEGRPRRAGLLARGSMPVRVAFPAVLRREWPVANDTRARRLQLRGQPGFHTRVPFSSSFEEPVARAALYVAPHTVNRTGNLERVLPFTLVLGGARSGKSAFAQAPPRRGRGNRRPAGHGRHGPGLRFGDGRAHRRHRLDRGPAWTTLEAPLDLAARWTGLGAATWSWSTA
jgi:hypothetical protein